MRPGFTGAGIDRADHLRLGPERIAALANGGGARLMLLDGLDPVLDEQGRLRWTDVPADLELIFLGLEGETALFAPLLAPPAAKPRWALFSLIERMAAQDSALWGAARSLLEWHGRHRFCGVCGAAAEPFRAGWGRRCTGCSAEHFPRVDPVVIMLAEHRGRVLLARQPQYPPRRYSALAGFVEPGESVEEAVAREIAEEAGIIVGDVRYVSSQPWPFPGQLMIACTATASSDSLTLDRTELEDAFWASRDEVRAALSGDPNARFLAPPPFAIAHTLLSHWVEAL